MVRTILLFRLLTMALSCLPLSVSAEDSMAADISAPTLSYARLYVDTEGVSHYGDAELQLSLEDYAPPANPIAVHALTDSGSATLVFLPPGTSEDWHPAPRHQFAIIVRGTVEVTAGDGEARRFGPGDIVLLEDTTGIGHQTRVVGDEGNLTVMVAVADD